MRQLSEDCKGVFKVQPEASYFPHIASLHMVSWFIYLHTEGGHIGIIKLSPFPLTQDKKIAYNYCCFKSWYY